MGAWNCTINGNDTAQDLISEYQAAFYYNDIETALKKICEYANRYIEQDEICDFIYSLADFMWKKGILTEDVKNEAIKLIDSNYGLEIWKESGNKILEKRKKVLKEFKEKLLSPQPSRKKISLGINITPIFEQGDIVTFQLKLKNLDCSKYPNFDTSLIEKYDEKYIVFRKIFNHISYTSSIEPNVKNVWAIFQIIPLYFDEEPTLKNLSHLFNNEIEFKEMILTDSNLFYFKRRKYKLLGNKKDYIKEEETYINDYKENRNFNQVRDIFFSVNRPWYHPEIEFIKKINELKEGKNEQ